ncbi:hypothetical protein BH09BAC2_BH09BAC2_12950 [soil metagenome]
MLGSWSKVSQDKNRSREKCKAPKRAMHKADGDLMENTTDTNRKQADKRNSLLTDGNEDDGGENAC